MEENSSLKIICFFFLVSQAASFGKVFSADYNPEKYVEMCRILRVLNAVRDPKIGIPLTYTQYPFLQFYHFFFLLLLMPYYCIVFLLESRKSLKYSEIQEFSVLAEAITF